jgi:hypothetical protein
MDDASHKSGASKQAGTPGLWKATIEYWLTEAVVPVFDATQTDPSQGIPAKDVAAAPDAAHDGAGVPNA